MRGNYYKSALFYAITLNLKHIYLYSAPAFGLLFLRNQVFNQPSLFERVRSFVLLGLQTICIFVFSFGLVIYQDPLNDFKQIMSRLFPFERGLVHDYMCPNLWCLYTAGLIAWKRLARLYQSAWLKDGQTQHRRFIQSDLGNYEFYKSLTTLVTVVFLAPVVVRMWRQINPQNFCKFLALTNFVAYNFGYHTHEKALLMVYIPLLFSSETNYEKLRVHLLGIVMIWSFLPLIPGLDGCLIKNSLAIA